LLIQVKHSPYASNGCGAEFLAEVLELIISSVSDNHGDSGRCCWQWDL